MNPNIAYQLGVAAENTMGDEAFTAEVQAFDDTTFFVGMCAVPGAAIIPTMAVANIEARGFEVMESDSGLGGQTFTALCRATENVPNIAEVVGE